MTIYSFESKMFNLLDIKTKQMRDTVYRPFVDIYLTNEDKTVLCSGLVDSGADYCQFPSRLIDQLGLKENQDRATSVSVGSRTEAFVHTVKISILSFPDIPAFEAPICFVDNMNEDWILSGRCAGMLGQIGFFDMFKVSFDSRKRTFALEPYTN
jgi:predicted aspartyl protease